MDLVYVFKASWIFFAVWSFILLALSAIAFGRELLPVVADVRRSHGNP